MAPTNRTKGNLRAWRDVARQATRLAPGDAWRDGVARALREATGASFVAVHTTSPENLFHIEHVTFPGDFDPLMMTVRQRFLARIESAGEGWRHGLTRGGVVHAPLEFAKEPALADEMRRCLADSDIDGYLTMLFLDDRQRLLGMALLGGEASSQDLLAAHHAELVRAARAASSTLAGAIMLARACGAELTPMTPPRVPPNVMTQPTPDPRSVVAPALDALTPREREVARWLAEGYSALNTGAQLGLSEQTVYVHTRNIYQKLGIHTRVELARLVHGL